MILAHSVDVWNPVGFRDHLTMEIFLASRHGCQILTDELRRVVAFLSNMSITGAYRSGFTFSEQHFGKKLTGNSKL